MSRDLPGNDGASPISPSSGIGSLADMRRELIGAHPHVSSAAEVLPNRSATVPAN